MNLLLSYADMNTRSLPLLLSTFALFLFLTLRNIESVGITNDECRYGENTMKLLLIIGQNPLRIIKFWFDPSVSFAEKGLNFSFPCYFMAPLMLLFGNTAETLKLFSLFNSLFFLGFVFLIARRCFNQRVALAVTALLATNPRFIHLTRIGFDTLELFVSAPFYAGIFFFILFFEKRNTAWLYAAALLAGFSLSVRLSAAPRIIALLLPAGIIYRRDILNRVKELPKLPLVAGTAVILFAAGGFLAFKGISKKDFKLENICILPEADNGVISGNFKKRVDQLNAILQSRIRLGFPYPNRLNSMEPAVSRSFLSFLFYAASLLGLASIFLFQLRPYKKRVIFIYSYFLVCFLFSLLAAEARRHDLAILSPMRQLTFALAFEALYIFLKTLFFRFRKYFSESLLPGLLSAGIFLGIPLIFNASLLYAYHNIYAYTGGRYLRSPSVQEAFNYVTENDIYPVIVYDWGLGHVVNYMFWFYPNPPVVRAGHTDISGIKEYSKKVLGKYKKYYILKMFFDPATIDRDYGLEPGKFHAMLDKLSRKGYVVDEEKRFFNKTGDETCAIYKVSK